MLMLMIIPAGLMASGNVNYIFNMQTCQTAGKGIILFDCGHRYFDPEKHTTNVNIGLGYGIFDSWDVYAARAFKNADTVVGTKVNLLDDYSGDSFLSLAFHAGGGYKEDRHKTLKAGERPSLFLQPVVQKNFFTSRFTIGMAPTFAYGTEFYGVDSKYNHSLGCGFFTAYWFMDRVALCGELIMNLYGFAFKYMNYSAGFKYAGYRHTFALWLGNSSGYSPVESIVGNKTLSPRLGFTFTREFDITL